MKQPLIIQGGMGVAVSSWQLARAVSQQGQMGVVSGTGIDVVLTRRLQMGDVGGHIRRAFDHFPIREIAERVWERYFVPGGKAASAAFKSKPVPSLKPPKALTDLLVLANFVEVWLAKEGHDGVVGINLLEKIQLPTLPSIFGAMLAKVDYVIMGAGIPRAIPGILSRFAAGETADLDIRVVEGDAAFEGDKGVKMTFDPADYGVASLPRPYFLAVVSSNSLATMLARKCHPPVDGFVIEGATAGGHNAPPRGDVQLNERGEPIYGERDIPDLQKFNDLGLPYWLAGSWAGRLKEALAEGAAGIQVGTAFAFCDESGLRPDLKRRVVAQSRLGGLDVLTDAKASPTGFPFKVLSMEGTMSQAADYHRRTRICDLGYLREVYRKPDGELGYRCPSEPVEDFVAKGGDIAETVGRKCICNGLLATNGLPQSHKGVVEAPIVTSGDDVVSVYRYLKPGRDSYTASDVLDVLLDRAPAPQLAVAAT